MNSLLDLKKHISCRWYRQLMLILFIVGFIVSLSYYRANYGVWRDLVLETSAYAKQQATWERSYGRHND